MPPEQTASWLGLLDLHQRLADGWTLIGGQLVHLHCAERGLLAVRPTNDADTVIDVRAAPTMLATFTNALTDLGFTSAGISAEGLQHRWVRGDASIDVLLPDGVGERARLRHGVTGSPTLATAGGTQALQRSETVAVMVAGREGAVRRPNLVGALVGKAAALANASDPGLGRHRRDFAILAGLLTARDFRSEELTKKDRQRLRAMVAAVQQDGALLLEVPSAEVSLDRLVMAADL
ncbi:hypothetical protein GUY44_13450 [Pimelobacter simplex]|uniref:Nucleotidyl transferase AbiEii/AbiGii toxin family protein n=1 Tax=Nocardioides simplex TaxID=2045 RepID=A0A0A1DL37_NOCSI|nr:hypothetical protein [Pimelobacter simplex]AIY17288.1 hypothetical protein KR76_11935 [Pimelobacter simplex]MCG8151491.1 hypothetical protein [Pimelobacter simplex]